MRRNDDPLPLFSGEDGGAVERIGIQSPEAFAYRRGFKQGANGESKSYRYDPDERVNTYYEDGHRIGRLFRPLPCMAGITRRQQRRRGR